MLAEIKQAVILSRKKVEKKLEGEKWRLHRDTNLNSARVRSENLTCSPLMFKIQSIDVFSLCFLSET